MKDWNKEEFETLINGKRYLFTVKYDGYIWVARCFQGTKIIDFSGHAFSSEKASLNLVKLIESKKKSNGK